MPADSEKRFRCFIALSPPEKWIDELAQVQRALQTTIHGEIKWSEPAAIHLTLRFLGQINSSELESLGELLRAIARRKKFTVRSAKLGVFPNARQPGVIWAGVEDADLELAGLHAEVNAATKAIGQPPEHRLFQPHLTLARVGQMDKTGPKILQERLREMEWHGGEWEVRALEVFQSDLSPAGARYTSRGSFPLTGSSLPGPGLERG